MIFIGGPVDDNALSLWGYNVWDSRGKMRDKIYPGGIKRIYVEKIEKRKARATGVGHFRVAAKWENLENTNEIQISKVLVDESDLSEKTVEVSLKLDVIYCGKFKM